MGYKDGKYTLYWSALETYENCPRRFLWGRGWGTLDVGGGPGRKKPAPFKQSKHDALMGIVIQAVVERFYNDELWRQPMGLLQRLEDMIDETFYRELKGTYIDWQKSPAQADLLAVCHEGIQGFMTTLKAQRLLGPYARSEVELLAYVNKYTPIGGRADLIIRRDDTGISIFDGKNGKTKGKYTNPDQLRWYALIFYLAHRKMVDRLGFLYWRYPAGYVAEEGAKPDEGVDWVPYTEDDLKGLAQRAVDALKGMEKHQFDPTPTPPTCKFCEYESLCPERQAQKDGNRRVKKNVEPLFAEATGFVQFGFGDGDGRSPAKKE